MKKILIFALAATSALAAAAPAAAQYGAANPPIRSGQLQLQLQAGLRSGAITRAEAAPLRQQLMQLTRLERLYARDGVSGRERADLQHRTNTLRQDIRMAQRTGDDRYSRDDDRYSRDDDRDPRGSGYDRNRDGWDDRDGNRDGRWDVDARNDTNRDGWDDRDSDRDGRWDDEAGYGRERASGNQDGVVGQLIDRVTGNHGQRVGQRASADLGAIPSAYRSQYRDGDGVYYRSDGRRIYQINANTQTVLRIYAMNR